jgi:hypothetical protein
MAKFAVQVQDQRLSNSGDSRRIKRKLACDASNSVGSEQSLFRALSHR